MTNTQESKPRFVVTIEGLLEEDAPAPMPVAKPEVAGTLPKMTLYAHADVLKAVRRIAVDDGVQAQVILREALREYLAKRGHHFSDLSTGK